MADFIRHHRLSSDHEEEMCQKLIQLSFAKIVNSKNERGGAKLHKNLLILHLLQKARTERRRSSDSPTDMELIIFENATDTDSAEIEEEESTFDEAEILTNSEHEEEEESSLNPDQENSDSFRPPLLRFVSIDEEEEDVSVELSSSDAIFAAENSENILAPELGEVLEFAPAKVIVERHEDYFANTQLIEPLKPLNFSETSTENEISEQKTEEFDEKSRFSIISAKSKKSSSRDSGCSSGSSSPSSSEEEEDSGDSDDSLTSPPRRRASISPTRRRRKRKHRSPSFTENDATKKTCVDVDNAQLTGLISVFKNTGLAAGINSEGTRTDFEGTRTASDGICLASAADVGEVCLKSSSPEKTSCGAQTMPAKSISCPSLLELTCRS